MKHDNYYTYDSRPLQYYRDRKRINGEHAVNKSEFEIADMSTGCMKALGGKRLVKMF